MRNTNSPVATAVAVGFFLLFSGCIEIKKPLSDPASSEADEDLCGAWKLDDGNVIVYLLIGKTEVEDSPPLMKACLASYNGKSKEASCNTLAFSVTKLGNESYANWLSSSSIHADEKFDFDKKGTYQKWQNDSLSNVILTKYVLNGDRLTVWWDDDEGEKTLAAAKKNGEIDTDNPISVIKYLRKDSARLFPNGKGKSFIRMK